MLLCVRINFVKIIQYSIFLALMFYNFTCFLFSFNFCLSYIFFVILFPSYSLIFLPWLFISRLFFLALLSFFYLFSFFFFINSFLFPFYLSFTFSLFFNPFPFFSLLYFFSILLWFFLPLFPSAFCNLLTKRPSNTSHEFDI